MVRIANVSQSWANSQADVLDEILRFVQELPQEHLGRLTLNGTIFLGSCWKEELPEGAPVSLPPRSVRHQGEVSALTGTRDP